MTNIYFELNPSLPFLNVEATKGFFYLQYPSGYSYWEIQTEDGQKLKDGNYNFPQEVLDQWTTSDQVLIDNILEAAPWDVVVPEPTTTSTTTTEDPTTTTSTTIIEESTTTSTTTIVAE